MDGEAYEVGDVMQSELLHYVGTVRLDGFDADDELAGDLLIGVPGGDEGEDL